MGITGLQGRALMLDSIGIIVNPDIKNPYIKGRMYTAIQTVSNFFNGDLYIIKEALNSFKDLKRERYIEEGNEKSVIKNAQTVACFGGDGTIIHTVHLMSDVYNSNKILFSINTSEIGKLTKFDYTQESIKKIFGWTKASILEERKLVYQFLANDLKPSLFFNEVFLSAKKIANFSFNIDNEDFSFKASGLIISTPQGSTGMTHSYGGPTIAPSLHDRELGVITPVGVLRDKIEPIVTKLPLEVKSNGELLATTDGGIEKSTILKGKFRIEKSHYIRFMAEKPINF